ncbi:MAG: choline kinase family protein [Myxococcota bacterium]|nr:choline kinase family protein [Myxococcota bacterium]
MENGDEHGRLEEILQAVPGWETPPDAIHPLEGGITNLNYLVHRGEDRFVLRVGGVNTHLLGIDRNREYAISRIAADLSIGATVYAFLPDHGAMVTHFVDGDAVSAERASEHGVMSRIMSTVRRYHDGPAFPGTFSVFQILRTYERLASERGVAFPPSAATALKHARAIEQALGPLIDLVPCHNDLLAANFLEDGDTIRLLDWEYGGMGDRFFDLGNFAANQGLDSAGCQALVDAYFGEVKARPLAQLHLMRTMSNLRESFWGFLQSGISNLEFDFLHYAHTHLERVMDDVTSPQMVEWQAEVKVP